MLEPTKTNCTATVHRDVPQYEMKLERIPPPPPRPHVPRNENETKQIFYSSNGNVVLSSSSTENETTAYSYR